MTDRLLDADDLSRRWGIPKSAVYRLARGVIETVQLGRYRRWRLDVIEAYERGETRA